MIGKLLNIVTTPVRAVVSPKKFIERVIDESESTEHAITDTFRYVLTGKEKHEDMDGFMDFDDED